VLDGGRRVLEREALAVERREPQPDAAVTRRGREQDARRLALSHDGVHREALVLDDVVDVRAGDDPYTTTGGAFGAVDRRGEEHEGERDPKHRGSSFNSRAEMRARDIKELVAAGVSRSRQD